MKTVVINGKEQVYLSPKGIKNAIAFVKAFRNCPPTHPHKPMADKLAANLAERGISVE